MILTQKFYNQPTLRVAKDLLGKTLVRQIGRKKISAIIYETEAYVGPRDLASHAWRGRTRRTEVMFGPAGYWYVYLIYGMYYCLNIVTEKKDWPAAVLIRAVRSPDVNISYQLTNGPGKLCRYLKIDKTLNNGPAFGARAKIYIAKNKIKIKPSQIKRGKRIGIDYAGAYKDKLWRFYLK